jgi:MFS transporter, SP family, sugar:H+ symporter
MIGHDQGNLGAKVFFIFGSFCVLGSIYAYLLIPETKGLTLEQVDKMLEESNARTSHKWKPHSTFAAEIYVVEKSTLALEVAEHIEHVTSDEV